MAKLIFALMIALFPAMAALAQPARPLLVEGTKTIYQRVLTRPAAQLHSAPEGAVIAAIPAFQPFYVYGSEGDWTEVGPTDRGGPTGWLRHSASVAWKQNIVGAFTKATDRKRQLIFADRDRLDWLLNHEAMTAVQERLISEADAGILDESQGVVAIEPGEFVNIKDELYVMPILEFEEILHPLNYEDILVMEVATVPLSYKSPLPENDTDTGDFDVGIVFVLDTTQSMDPYIARTQRVLRRTVEEIRNSDVGKMVNFGAVGFRDNVEARPGLEYRTRILGPLKRREDQSEIVAAIGNAAVASVNSPGFNEDSLAGVEDAIDDIDWDQAGTGDPIDARYIILVTDAGPKDPRDPNARTEIGVAELQADAEGKNIVTMTIHLKTPVGGAANHDYAAARYRALSQFGGREYYFPVEGGSEDAFEGLTARLVTAVTDHVREALGQAPKLSEEEMGEDLAALGRAMRLAYLGARRGTQAPDILRGWVSDKAMENPARSTIEPRLLITKNELSTMATLILKIVTLAEQSQGGGEVENFFGQVQQVIATMAANPDMNINAEADTIGGALEYLERLPYKSQILTMDEDRWLQSPMRRRAIIDGMRQKLTLYRKWLFDADVWTALYDGAPDGEHVFAMPFDVLP